MYDIIGDVHGRYHELHALLSLMGYRYDRTDHVFAHETRKAVFVGDLIDAGDRNLRVITLVRNMVERGQAHAVMGNHEFNAVLYATPHPTRWDSFARPHNEENSYQHGKFLNEVNGKPRFYAAVIDWFKTLPVFLKCGDLHVIHACWDRAAINTLHIRRALRPDGTITPHGWNVAANDLHASYAAFEKILKGPEEDLGEGLSYYDAYGNERTRSRLQWWIKDPQTYGEAYMIPHYAPFADRLLPPTKETNPTVMQIHKGLQDVPLLVFGHYWMKNREPRPLAPTILCVDYSVVKPWGRLVAYRHQTGDKTFHARNFISVPRL